VADDTVYVLTVTNPDGTTYDPPLNSNTGIAVYGDQDLSQRLAAIEAAGKTAHVRPA